ncbi:hypothetical protein II906_12405, partial [bacterium]|nr:hypothetical protein [bacterium]
AYGSSAQPICITQGRNGETVTSSNMFQDDSSAPISLSGNYWSSAEGSGANARNRNFNSNISNFNTNNRSNTNLKALCVGDRSPDKQGNIFQFKILTKAGTDE